jgi:hypothetical protein
VSLLAAEIVASIGYVLVARKWMHQEALLWPGRSFAVAATSIITAAVSLGSMIFFPNAKWLILAITLFLFGWTIRRYWLLLPTLVTTRVINIASSFPPIRKFFQLII